ncbi:hypothetical protein HMPREF1980_02276 [Actinomyces sp. oral taxon 172 str. F0311]|nr:hypothetical protein HMPREF1980_02276 [Actinomyces sp. oral taxon 172 str. F0311]
MRGPSRVGEGSCCRWLPSCHLPQWWRWWHRSHGATGKFRIRYSLWVIVFFAEFL